VKENFKNPHRHFPLVDEDNDDNNTPTIFIKKQISTMADAPTHLSSKLK
jgi:hypothetical protein